MRTGNNQNLRQIPDPDWHTELTEYFVIHCPDEQSEQTGMNC